MQGEFTGAHLRLPSPELAPSGVELLGLGAEKGKKGEKGGFLFFWVFFAGMPWPVGISRPISALAT